MERLAYILDTNCIADYINGLASTQHKVDGAIQNQHWVYLCQPVHFEVLRGLLKNNAQRKMQVFEKNLMPQLDWLPLTDTDWRQAAVFWAQTRTTGKQLSDPDLLIAALTWRLNGILVSADADFDSLPIRRENWRAD